MYLYKGNKHGPRPVRKASEYLSKRVTTWRTLVVFGVSLYFSRNFARVVGLESPEPLANLYTRSYFRATWVTTALDAGFWTAMHLRPKWLKDIASLLFSVYYLACAEQADQVVRNVRGGLTLQHLRVSWDKANTPYIASFNRLLRPRKMHCEPKRIRIHRPKESSYTEHVEAWLYFDGPTSDLLQYNKVILDVPGGGFVAMDPRCHDDKLMAWAVKTGLPVLALDYKKAPEHPYPYALNECYDVYQTLVTSRGRCIGLPGTDVPKIIVSGDSAGGNLAVGLMLMLLQGSPHSSYFPDDRGRDQRLPTPEALVLIYPALDMNIGNWMTDEQMALIKAPERRKVNKGVLSRKVDDYRTLTPNTPHASDDEGDVPLIKVPVGPRRTKSSTGTLFKGDNTATNEPTASAAHAENASPVSEKKVTVSKTHVLRTRLAMSSMISYFNDRILSPEMLRAMIILYIGPYNRPDFATDFLLSPLLAPEAMLARFPKVYMLTGERDPLVDDTVIFAGRLRQAHLQRFQERQELGVISEAEQFDESRHVHVTLLPGISHGFLQFVSVFSEGLQYIDQCSRWMNEVFRESDVRDAETPIEERRQNDYFGITRGSRRTRGGSSDNDDRPLEMSSLSMTSITADQRRSSRRKSRGGVERMTVSGKGVVKKPATAIDGRRRSPVRTRKSYVKLASTDDLMNRRMHRLTGNLMGDDDVAETP